MNANTYPTKVQTCHAREVIDSRGNPTVEVDVVVQHPTQSEKLGFGRAIVPSGASTGEFEALELRDGDAKRFLGKGVLQAVGNVNKQIATALKGREFSRQPFLDDLLREIDGTENKSNLGANAILGVSMAYLRACANVYSIPTFQCIGNLYETKAFTLPTPFMNIINGGAHADNRLELQEFMIVPHGFNKFSEALRAGVETFHHLKKILMSKGESTAVGDEGGFAPDFTGEKPHEQGLDAIMHAISEAGYRPGKDISIALDCAASEFAGDDKVNVSYTFEGAQRKAEDMIEIYSQWLDSYPIVSFEDPLSEHDWAGWKKLTQALGSKCQLVGDDLFVTNPKFLSRGIEEKSANSILIKLNQIGTVTETLETIKLASQNGFSSITSHRSGETEDTFIAELSVGTASGQIKTGSASRTDRIAKYNQLLRIEEEHGDRISFAGSETIRGMR